MVEWYLLFAVSFPPPPLIQPLVRIVHKEAREGWEGDQSAIVGNNKVCLMFYCGSMTMKT
jgi:hypothetical protein